MRLVIRYEAPNQARSRGARLTHDDDEIRRADQRQRTGENGEQADTHQQAQGSHGVFHMQVRVPPLM